LIETFFDVRYNLGIVLLALRASENSGLEWRELQVRELNSHALRVPGCGLMSNAVGRQRIFPKCINVFVRASKW